MAHSSPKNDQKLPELRPCTWLGGFKRPVHTTRFDRYSRYARDTRSARCRSWTFPTIPRLKTCIPENTKQVFRYNTICAKSGPKYPRLTVHKDIGHYVHLLHLLCSSSVYFPYHFRTILFRTNFHFSITVKLSTQMTGFRISGRFCCLRAGCGCVAPIYSFFLFTSTEWTGASIILLNL